MWSQATSISPGLVGFVCECRILSSPFPSATILFIVDARFLSHEGVTDKLCNQFSYSEVLSVSGNIVFNEVRVSRMGRLLFEQAHPRF